MTSYASYGLDLKWARKVIVEENRLDAVSNDEGIFFSPVKGLCSPLMTKIGLPNRNFRMEITRVNKSALQRYPGWLKY